MTKDTFNFLPQEYLEKIKKKQRKRLISLLVPLLLLALLLPGVGIYLNIQEYKANIEVLQAEQEQLNRQLMEAQRIDTQIADSTEKMEFLGMLLNNTYKRVINIRKIETYVPKQISFASIRLLQGQVEVVSDAPAEGSQRAIYQNEPDFIVLEGHTTHLESIARFVYNLNQDPLLYNITLESISWNEELMRNEFVVVSFIEKGDHE